MLFERQTFMKLKNGGNVFELGQCAGPVTVSSRRVITEKINKQKR